MGDELRHFGTPGMKWGVRKAVEYAKKAGKVIRDNVVPLTRAGVKKSGEVLSKIGKFTLTAVRNKVNKGKQATQSSKFDDLFKTEMNKVRNYQNLIEKAAAAGNSHDQFVFARERDAALRRSKEYKRQRDGR